MHDRAAAGVKREKVLRFAQLADMGLDMGQPDVDGAAARGDDAIPLLCECAHQVRANKSARTDDQDRVSHPHQLRAVADRFAHSDLHSRPTYRSPVSPIDAPLRRSADWS